MVRCRIVKDRRLEAEPEFGPPIDMITGNGSAETAKREIARSRPRFRFAKRTEVMNSQWFLFDSQPSGRIGRQSLALSRMTIGDDLRELARFRFANGAEVIVSH